MFSEVTVLQITHGIVRATVGYVLPRVTEK